MNDKPSLEFQRLDEEIQRLKLTFLMPLLKDIDQNHQGHSPSPEGDLQLRAFIVLCHAEIEEYVEERSMKILEEAKAVWDNPNLTFFAVILEPFLKLNKKHTDFRDTIRKNNGIGEKHLKNIFSPFLGEEEVKNLFDPLWLEEMNYMSDLRGNVAHKSRGNRTQQPLNPGDLEERIEKVVYGRDRKGRLVYGNFRGLLSLDCYLGMLREGRRTPVVT
jgi:hypothetical protein